MAVAKHIAPVFLMMVLTLASTATRAENFFKDFQITGGAGLESFTWVDTNALGGRVAEESGSWFGFTLAANNDMRRTSGLVYGLEITSALGSGDYRGDAWTGVVVPPADAAITQAGTRSGYQRVGVHGGARYVRGNFGFNAIAAITNDYWSRTIKEGVSTSGTPTYGHDETVVFQSARLAGGIDFTLSRFRISVTAGPVISTGVRTVTLDVPGSSDTIDVDMRFKYAYFAALDAMVALDAAQQHRVGIGARWNEFVTKASADVHITPNGTAYLQPGAEIQTLSVLLGYSYTF